MPLLPVNYVEARREGLRRGCHFTNFIQIPLLDLKRREREEKVNKWGGKGAGEKEKNINRREWEKRKGKERGHFNTTC